MASSNRHWPSMFKSKPCNTHNHHQWQHHDIISSGCHRSPYSSGCEERSPEPKPRWNPKPEQIRILEAIFNSGMVNPPRDEIRKIRAQLQEYGQVGDANVFYWFQNRKSRSKHKQRNLQNAAAMSQNNHLHHQPPISATTTAPTSSSSSSDKSSPNSNKAFSLLNSPTGSVNQQVQPYFGEFLQEPYFFQPGYHVGSTNAASGGFTQGFGFPELGNVIHGNGNDQTVGSSSLLTDLLMMNHGISPKNGGNNTKAEGEKMRMQQQLNYYTQPPSTSAVHSILPPTSTVNIPSPISQVQGMGENGGFRFGRSTVFINDMPIDVGAGPIDVREAIGDDCVLIHSTGQLVLTDEWGVTIQPLKHGAFYYVVPRSFNPSPLGTLNWYSPYHPTNTNLIRI